MNIPFKGTNDGSSKGGSSYLYTKMNFIFVGIEVEEVKRILENSNLYRNLSL